MVSGSISLRSQRIFSPFPRGTCSLSVASEYFALRSGLRRFTRSFTYIALLRVPLDWPAVFNNGALTLCGALFQALCLTGLHHVKALQPQEKTPGLGTSAFVRHYLRNRIRFLFLTLLRCFTSGGIACPPTPVSQDSRDVTLTRYRLSHSEIPGSWLYCS
jgi:hypothetical protein